MKYDINSEKVQQFLYFMKQELEEDSFEYFTDEQLLNKLELNKGDVKLTLYRCLRQKAFSGQIVIDGMTTPEIKTHFLELAIHYRPNHSTRCW